jgi:hypothetical protein
LFKKYKNIIIETLKKDKVAGQKSENFLILMGGERGKGAIYSFEIPKDNNKIL